MARGRESAGAKLSATEPFTLALPNRLFYDGACDSVVSLFVRS